MDYPVSDATARLHPTTDKFTDGDVGGGIPASKDSAEFQNAVYDEILAVITAAGLTPDEGDLTQLLQAIQDGAGLLNGAKYFEVPGGWILQFAFTGAVATGSVITFPIAFPTLCSVVLLTENQTAYNNAADSLTTTDFTFFHTSGSDNGSYYLAIGR